MKNTTSPTEIHELAVATDTELARLYTEAAAARNRIAAANDTAHYTIHDKRNRWGGWATPTDEAWDKAEEVAANVAHEATRLAAAKAKIAEARQALRSIFEAEQPLDAIFAEHRWNRFFLVTSSVGHIHRSLNCQTCHVTTEFAWLPDLSGLTEAEAVEAHGEILCSVCFPDAPVAWTQGEAKATVEARQAKAAAKAERDAKKLAKALLPDGSELRINNGRDRFATLASAKSWLTDAAEWNRGRVPTDFHPSYRLDATLTVVEAVAAKTGDSPEVVIEAAIKRAAKR